jgi:hypothetical protein
MRQSVISRISTMKMPFILSVPQLLTVLAGLGTVTLGIVAFDAERLIGAVDDLKGLQQADHVQITTNTNAISSLTPRVDTLEGKYVEVDHRLIRLEPR